jgi:alpha-beta hydrolase superfamily lysophospholipase
VSVLGPIHLDVDITGEVPGIEGPLHQRVTAYLPPRDLLLDPAVVLFAFPGGGASRGMYCTETHNLTSYSQARWHAERGAVFVAVDHLGTGESAHPDPALLSTPEPLALANKATSTAVLRLLAGDRLSPGWGALGEPAVLAMGHSMGGALTIILQGQHDFFDGVAILGYSAFHTTVPLPPDATDDHRPRPHRVRNSPPENLGIWAERTFKQDRAARQWFGRWDDEEAEEMRRHRWIVPLASKTMPPAAQSMNSVGYASEEASRILSPVFLGYGVRDVGRNPWEEPRYFWRSRDVQLAVIPRMTHGINSAATRAELWQRLHHWAVGVAERRGQERLD